MVCPTSLSLFSNCWMYNSLSCLVTIAILSLIYQLFTSFLTAVESLLSNNFTLEVMAVLKKNGTKEPLFYQYCQKKSSSGIKKPDVSVRQFIFNFLQTLISLPLLAYKWEIIMPFEANGTSAPKFQNSGRKTQWASITKKARHYCRAPF